MSLQAILAQNLGTLFSGMRNTISHAQALAMPSPVNNSDLRSDHIPSLAAWSTGAAV